MRERPRSIIYFERLFLGMIGVSVLRWTYSWLQRPLLDPLPERVAGELRYQMVIFSISTLIHLLLWFLVARRGSAAAKWILVALAAINLIGVAMQFYGRALAFDTNASLALLAFTLYYLAVGCLFRPDAKAWFDRRRTEAEIFR
jgi:hypothetical protein